MCSARSARSGSSSSALEVLLELRVGLRPGAARITRLVVVAVAQLARVVGDHRVAALGGELEPVEHAAELVADVADELVRALAGAARGSPSRRRGRGRRAPGRRTAGSRPPRARACGRGCRRRSATSARCEQRRRSAPGSRSALASSERRNACRYSCGLCSSSRSGSWRARLSARTSVKTSSSRCSPAISVGVAEPSRSVGERAADLVAGDVVAEQHPAQAVERGRARRVARRGSSAAKLDALGGLLGGLVLDRLELQQRRVRGDLHVGAGEHAAHAAGERRGQRRLHLHRLDDRDDVALGHLVALGDRDRDDHGRAAGSARSRRRRG